MYLEYYKLSAKPFQITADPKFLWLGEKHKEAMATLRYGILDNRGFLLLTGEVGTGKTVMIHRIVSLLDIDTVVATLPDPDLESMDFYYLLAEGLKLNRKFNSKGEFLICLRDFLHQSYEKHQQVLLIIDESQRLNHRLMEDIRVLSNIELHDRKLINIFFVGQQEFNSILMTPQNRALAQRITVRYHIHPLDLKETGQYIAHRLKVAGSTNQIFKPSAVEKIYQFSGGIPRLINIISDHAMLTGYARDVLKLDDTIIAECAEELRIPVTMLKSEAATIQSPVGVSATAAGDRSAPASVTASTPQPPPASNDTASNPATLAEQPLSWKLVYAGVIVLLIALVAFGITHFTGNSTQRWDEEALTPQKYKTTLEKEKSILAKKLENGAPVEETVKAEKMEPESEPEPEPIIETAPAPEPEDTSLITEKRLEPLPLIKEKVLIQFKINSNEIDTNSYVLLDRVAEYLISRPDAYIFVRGYTDTIGSASYNVSVSRFRASAVKSYLVGKGVIPEKITVFAMGANNPIAPNNTLAGRQQNRRVEIEFPSQQSTSN